MVKANTYMFRFWEGHPPILETDQRHLFHAAVGDLLATTCVNGCRLIQRPHGIRVDENNAKFLVDARHDPLTGLRTGQVVKPVENPRRQVSAEGEFTPWAWEPSEEPRTREWDKYCDPGPTGFILCFVGLPIIGVDRRIGKPAPKCQVDIPCAVLGHPQIGRAGDYIVFETSFEDGKNKPLLIPLIWLVPATPKENDPVRPR